MALEPELMPRKVLPFLAKSNSRCNSLSQVELSPGSDGNAPSFVGTGA